MRYEVKINVKRCKGCRLCVFYCPKKNLTAGEALNEIGVYPAVVVSDGQCSGCGFCLLMCPEACIEIE